MNSTFFPLRQFTQALAITSKVKQKLYPFIVQVQKGNMEWIFQMFSQMYQYTVLPDSLITYKFNSLVALKLLLDTCQFPIVLLTQVYFLSHIRKIATYQINLPEKQRGIDFFYSQGYQKNQQSKKFGYNYVRLACQIISMFSVIKPYKLYKNEQLTQQSQFVAVLDIMRAQQWKEYQILVFYNQNPVRMRQIYLQNLIKFQTSLPKYYLFFQKFLQKYCSKNYFLKGIDPKKILQSSQAYACNYILPLLIDLLTQQKTIVSISAIKLITQFVKWGYIRAFYMIQTQKIFDQILEMIKLCPEQDKSLERGKQIFKDYKGTQQQKKQLYAQILRSLQIWTICISKSIVNQQKQSKISKLYKFFVSILQLQFPNSINMKKIKNENDDCLEKNRQINLMQIKQLKNITFFYNNLRRNSTQIKQLARLDHNMIASIKSIMNDAKLIVPRRITGRRQESLSQTNKKSLKKSTKSGHTIKNNQSSFLQIQNDIGLRQMSQMPKAGFHDIKPSTSIADNLIRDSNNGVNSYSIPQSSQFSEDQQEQSNYTNEVDQNGTCNELKNLQSSGGLKFQQKQQDKKSIFHSQNVSSQSILSSSKTQDSQIQSNSNNSSNSDKKEKVDISKKSISNSQSSQKMTFFKQNSKSSSQKIQTLKNVTNNKQLQKSKQSVRSFVSSIKTLQNSDQSKNATQLSFKKTENMIQDRIIQKKQANNISAFGKKITTQQYNLIEKKLLNLQVEKAQLQFQLLSKQLQLNKYKQNEKKANFIFPLQKQNITQVPKLAQYQKKIQFQKNNNYLQYYQKINSFKYKQEMEQLKSIQIKKLLKNKDILVQNDKLQLGFIFNINQYASEITFYLTAVKHLQKISYKILAKRNIQFFQQSQVVTQVLPKKQKKISFNFQVKPPYELPQCLLKYTCQGKSYQQKIVIPISFNKFVMQGQKIQKNQSNIKLCTQVCTISKKMLPSLQKLKQYWPHAKIINCNFHEVRMQQVLCYCQKIFQLTIIVQNQQLIQILCEFKKKDEEILQAIQFFMQSLKTILTY